MARKKIGVIVSSASSEISGVVVDTKRLSPDGDVLNKFSVSVPFFQFTKQLIIVCC